MVVSSHFRPFGPVGATASLDSTHPCLCDAIPRSHVNAPDRTLYRPGVAARVVTGAAGSNGRSGAPLNPAKLKLLKAATGLPVHTTSIGRRASASYCV